MGAERITIDEIQRAPTLLSAIKPEVDRKRTPGRFQCTGSANLLLMRQVSKPLAGRAVYLEILPFTWSELERVPLGSSLDAPVAAAALRNSSLLNIAQLAQDAGIPPSTAARYLSLLEVSFRVWKLSTFTVNRGKWLARSPRLPWVDSGLAAAGA